ncbi:unnamed protein product [Diatraea saccharalis]|uniref:Sushi domain-containing protein n=1 Tax=Diatraea saccharalis TaxID=40085 RepID=A0A9N9RH66_9NEOP|nr:unnamed protein product [Diatraea saccharalis]
MSVLVIFLFCHIFGTLAAWPSHIDINRVKLLTNKTPHSTNQGKNYVGYQYKRSNNYDNYSSRYSGGFSSNSPETIKVYEPREDPRLFYQSDSYIKESNNKNINRTVSEIYPGREVVRPDEFRSHSLPIFADERNSNLIDSGFNNFCIRCPHDRTIIAKPGSDRVMLQSPTLLTCSGLIAPKEARFSTVYGPQFGALIENGSHMIIGRISYGSKILKMCKMQVHVMLHDCPVPSYLVSRCDEKNKLCKFTCRDPSLELHGQTSLSCGDKVNGMWNGKLPVCKVRSWCLAPTPPEHGHLSCKGTTIGGSNLSEGSICRVHCPRGWHWSPRAATVCRRGAWTYNLTCQLKKRRRH